MLSKKRDWKRIIRYVLLGVVFYFVFLYLTFPAQLIKDRVLEKISKTTGMPLHAKTVSLGIVSGVRLQDLEIQTKQDTLALKRVSLRPALLGLLTGKQGGSFKVRSGGLNFSGSFSKGKADSKIKISSQQSELLELLGLLQKQELELKGKLNGSFSLNGPTKELMQQNLAKAEGKLNLKLTKLLMNTKKIILPPSSGLFAGPLSERFAGFSDNKAPVVIPFESLTVRGKLDKGELELSKVDLKGKEFSGQASGKIKLSPRLELSQLELPIELTLDDKYIKKMKEAKAFFPKGVELKGNKLSLTLGGTLSRPAVKKR